ncbi:MAG: PQQ-dependent sugar dehydrogenase [Rhizobiaceae bacterium]|nr:PQQ-dependent sugar dehydrogenase [Rhizobiaceae bacterium]
MRNPAILSISLVLMSSVAFSAQAREFQTSAGTVTATTLADGLRNPWGMQFLPDGAILVTEREGDIRIVKNGTVGAPLPGLPAIAVGGQGGLLDVAKGCDFDSDGTIFVSYSKPGDGGFGTAVARATLVRDGETGGRLENMREIFAMNRMSGGGRHFGSRIVVAPDCNLFITTGDRGDAPRSQDMDDHAGAVLRITPDGGIPADNPYAGGGALPELWSKGHRNPQGAVFDPVDNVLITVEHGARGGDEINRPQPGRNYGWPIITFGRDYSGLSIGEGTEKDGLEQPLMYWDPSIAPSGMAVYRGAMFPEWGDDVFVGALAGQMLVRVERDGEKFKEAERLFEGELGRVRDVRIHPDGSIYLLIDDDPGQLIRIAK